MLLAPFFNAFVQTDNLLNGRKHLRVRELNETVVADNRIPPMRHVVLDKVRQ